MRLYHKIDSVFKRHEKTKKFVRGEFARDEFCMLQRMEWAWTEKLDGTNVRVGWGEDQRFRYGGKTEDAQMPVHLMEELQESLPEAKVREVFSDAKELVLYGEGIGHKIQSVGKLYHADRHEFVLFDVRIGSWWLRREDVEDVAKKLGVRHVPIVMIGSLNEAVDVCSKGPVPSLFGTCDSEGIVLRPLLELQDRAGHRIITKLKYRDFEKGWHE